MSDYDIDKVLKTIFNVEEPTWHPSDKIPLIIKEIEYLKHDVKTFLDNKEDEVAAFLKETEVFCEESTNLVQSMELCKQEIEQETMAEILKSIEKFEVLAKELRLVHFGIDIVFAVGQCGRYVKYFDEGREARSFTKAIEAVYDLVLFLETPAEGFKAMDFCNNTKHTAKLILDNLLQDLSVEWSVLVTWCVKPGTDKKVVTLTLNFNESDAVADVLNALEKASKLDDKVSELSQFILKELLIPIIHNDCIVFAETDELVTVTINLNKNVKPTYDAVISNLRLLFHYLSNKLNVEFNVYDPIMRRIGKQISKEFREVLINDCLIDTIPNNIYELQTYGRITAELEDFQHFLAMVKIFPDDSFSILSYMDDIDVLFASKSSQYFLETARAIMIKDLSATMSIGVESIPNDDGEASGSSNESSAEEALKILDKTIPKSLFYFPRCMISKTAQELLDLVYVMMEQAVQCSDVVCKKLYNTTRLVFELYDAVVPYHHENYLQTIPQYVALFHNNCMYLAHNLQTFGDKWLILMEGREPDYAISFVDLVQKLRDLGHKHLAIHMQQQRKQILDSIRSSDLNNMVTKDVLGANAEAALRQCGRQLQLLKNVWIGVFPLNVFTKLMATLVNMLMEELVHRTCCCEDLSAAVAAQLADGFELVGRKAPLLFQNPADIESHVKSWPKLEELIFVLRGNLKDIEAHWADGSGPLAVHFRTEELRNLIKALFQNTQFRANLLSKIK